MTANYCDGDDHAYPHGEHGQILGGLTKRELFAAMAMQGLCAYPGEQESVEFTAANAVGMADALIAELSK